MNKTGKQYRDDRNGDYGQLVRLTAKSLRDIRRLKEAYGFQQRRQVLEYLIEQGVAGLDGTQPQVVDEGGA